MCKIAVAIAGLILCITGHAAEDSTWVLEPRELPAPQGVSPELHQSIAGTSQPDVESSSTSPQSDAEWEALIARFANPIPLQLIEERLGIEIEADQITNVKVYRVSPPEVSPEHEGRLFLYAHGGAYVFNGGDAAVSEAALVTAMAGMESIAIDYRMPPGDPFPAAVDDFVAVYLELIRTIEPGKIAFGGSSAGAGLALAALHKLKQLDAPMPGAVYAGSPWADLTKTGDTMYTNEGIDRILVTYDGYLGGAARLYANGEDLTDPLLSPVYGEFSDFPPTIFVSGTRDLFLSDTVRTHRKMRAAGVVADLHVYEAMSHTGYGFMRQAPESNDWYQELIKFLQIHLQ